MSNQFFEQPILNSPYEYPRRHWELDENGQPTQNIIDKRRIAEFITPIPKTPEQGVLGKNSRGDWRFHYPNTLPQRMTSLSLLACSYVFTAEMYLDFAESFQP